MVREIGRECRESAAIRAAVNREQRNFQKYSNDGVWYRGIGLAERRFTEGTEGTEPERQKFHPLNLAGKVAKSVPLVPLVPLIPLVESARWLSELATLAGLDVARMLAGRLVTDSEWSGLRVDWRN